MSFYRTLLAAVAALAIASPVFAADDAAAMPNTEAASPAAPASDNMMMQQASADDAQATQAAPAASASSDAAADSKVDLNKATAKELMKVKGIKASHARAIVTYRKKHGDFKTTDDLSKVKGFTKMKNEKLKEIQDQLTVG